MKNGKSDKQWKNTSKFISLILRHQPEVIGIALDEHGWADVQELIDGINRSEGHTLDMELIRMYDNEEPEEVPFLCHNEVMKGVIDQFGIGITVKKVNQDHFRIKVKAFISPNFYSWVF